MLKFAFAFILVLLSLGASAQSILQTQVNTVKTRWSGFGGMGYSSNFQPRGSYDSEVMTSGHLLVNYRLSGSNLLRVNTSAYQQHTQGRETKMNDSQLNWVNNAFWRQGKVLTIGQQVRGAIPTSKESYQRDEKYTGVSIVPTFIANLTPMGVTGVTLSYLPSFTRNFHKYERSRAFQGNTEYSMSHTMAVSWSVTDSVYVQPSFVYSQGWTYGGVKKDDNYQFVAEVGYMVDSFIFATGLSNAGAVRKLEQANDQTIQLFDNKTASVYADVTYAF